MLAGTQTWLRQSITVYPKTGYSSFGQSTYGSPITIQCLIQKEAVNTRDKEGNEVLSSTQIIVNGSESITAEDKIVLPDTRTPYIIMIKEITGFDGNTFAKVIYT